MELGTPGFTFGASGLGPGKSAGEVGGDVAGWVAGSQGGRRDCPGHREDAAQLKDNRRLRAALAVGVFRRAATRGSPVSTMLLCQMRVQSLAWGTP
jgi:hypothetical protein